jgi:hypothetical protein
MRGRRWTTLVVAVALALGGLVGIGATPAAADPQGGTLQGVYYDGQFCNSYGSEGVQTGRWSWYYCESRYAYYFLWSFTY